LAEYVGQAVPRVEDARLLTGRGRYTDDVAHDDATAAWAVFMRAPHAHARILAVDIATAAAMPGVLGVLTAADYVADGCQPIRHASNPPDALLPAQPWFVPGPGVFVHEAPQPPLAGQIVRFPGEAVAMVVAETRESARDAAEQINVSYESLPAITSIDDALTGAPLGEGVRGNLCLEAILGDLATTDAAFAHASVVVQHDFTNQRLVNCQMEPRAALGLWDPHTARATLISGGQGVVRQRLTLAECLGLKPPSVRVISPDVGGGFGPRTPLSPEAVLVTWAARRLGRSVRWSGDRSEAFLTDYQARDLRTHAELALDGDGNILGLRVRLAGNLGAYPVTFAPLANGSRIVSTVYAIPTAVIEVRGLLTNSVPTAPYRGAGRPEATLAIERLLDLAAARLGIDRVLIRRRNLISRAQLPYRTVGGFTYDCGDFTGNMDRTLAMADWAGVAARKRASQAKGLWRGSGIANYVETPVGAPRERVVLRVDPTGIVFVTAGTQSSGQGHETVFAQIVAEHLGIAITQVRLLTGDTDVVQVGGGSHSDRSARLGATLLARACASLRARAREAASCLPSLAISPDPDLFALAEALHDGKLPSQFGTELSVAEEINERLPAYPTGCAICEVEIDPATGETRIDRYSSIDDVGQPINPMIVHGQVHGGIVQGVGQALLETMIQDSTGQILTGSLMDYALPRADNVPSFRLGLTEDPTSSNPLRIKGGGEGGITPAIAVIINAIVDALSHAGITDVEMPATSEKIWRLIQTSGMHS